MHSYCCLLLLFFLLPSLAFAFAWAVDFVPAAAAAGLALALEVEVVAAYMLWMAAYCGSLGASGCCKNSPQKYLKRVEDHRRQLFGEGLVEEERVRRGGRKRRGLGRKEGWKEGKRRQRCDG
jgi:hypothetical protein